MKLVSAQLYALTRSGRALYMAAYLSQNTDPCSLNAQVNTLVFCDDLRREVDFGGENSGKLV